MLVLYLLFVLVGLIPVNNAFQSAQDGVEVKIISTAIHADLVLPLVTDTIDWRELFPASCFRGDTSDATHISIGWGDKGFFIHTPRWSDLKLSVASNALLWPSETCIHVRRTRAEWLTEDARSTTLSPAQYKRMVSFVLKSFAEDQQQRFVQIPGEAYGMNDAFFEARGSYHALNTCNSWVGRALRESGVRTGLWTPLPKTVFWYLPTPNLPPPQKDL